MFNMAFDPTTEEDRAINRAILLATWVLALSSILTEWPPDNLPLSLTISAAFFWIGMVVGGVILLLLAWETYRVYR